MFTCYFVKLNALTLIQFLIYTHTVSTHIRVSLRHKSASNKPCMHSDVLQSSCITSLRPQCISRSHEYSFSSALCIQFHLDFQTAGNYWLDLNGHNFLQKSIMFDWRTAWWWATDQQILILGWTVPLRKALLYVEALYPDVKCLKHKTPACLTS